MLKKEIKKESETQSENFIHPGASLQKHHTLVTLTAVGMVSPILLTENMFSIA